MDRRTLLLFLLALAILLGVGWLAYRTTGQLVHTNERVTESYRVLSELDALFAAIQEAESSRRGFWITGHPEHLAVFEHSVTMARQGLRTLDELLTGRPVQYPRLETMRPLVQGRLAMLEEALAMQQESRMDQARAQAVVERGHEATMQIREVRVLMDQREQEMLAARHAESQRAVRNLYAALVGGFLVGFGLLIGIFYLLTREVWQRRRTEAALRESEERFRLLVADVKDYAIYMLDPAGRVALWNAGAERITGYGEQEALGQPYSVFYTPEDLEVGLP
jgi:CHASE3 domain sensor protein